MKIKEGEIKVFENQSGLQEEAIGFQIEGNEHWVKRYLGKGRYEIFGLIAIGGFGCVFGAYDHWNYKKQVVIKTPFYMGDYCRPYIARSHEAFEKQIKSLNKLYEQEKKHLCGFSNAGFDSIVNLNAYFFDTSLDLSMPFRDAAGVQYYVEEELRENAPYLVMKYIRGEMLKEIIVRTPLDVVFTLRLAKQILVLLRYLHKHRKTQKGRPFYYLLCDLKAENVMITDDHVSLIDFGAVKIHWMDQKEIDIPIFVTDGYAAPEVYSGSLEFRDNPRIDKRFDIFTLGALMIHCLTGKHPQEFLVNHCPPQHDFNLENLEVPDPIPGILARSTARNREERYADADDMLKDIWQALETFS
mgnify:CR=1 FL=1